MGGAWAILAGDSVHCFGDGVLIASAFIADMHLGALASLAVLAHEIPTMWAIWWCCKSPRRN